MRALLVQNCDVEDFGRYRRALEAQGHACRVVRGDGATAFPPPREWDAVLVGGTPTSAKEFDRHPRYRAEWAFLRAAVDAGKACFGVCCGAQVLARLLGASVRRLDAMELGTYAARLTDAGRDDPLFAGVPASFPVFHWHRDAFDLPEGAAHLVSQDGWPLQAFKKGVVAGVLFHLELAAEDVARWTRAYADELSEAGRTEEEVLAAVRRTSAETATVADAVVRNYVALLERRA